MYCSGGEGGLKGEMIWHTVHGRKGVGMTLMHDAAMPSEGPIVVSYGSAIGS